MYRQHFHSTCSDPPETIDHSPQVLGVLAIEGVHSLYRVQMWDALPARPVYDARFLYDFKATISAHLTFPAGSPQLLWSQLTAGSTASEAAWIYIAVAAAAT